MSIDGEREYKQALSELNSGNKVLASEMKKLKAEYQGNTESVEFLTKKGELLERQLLQQRDKVETLRKAVAAAAEANGEADASTQAWIVRLNNAEAQMFDLEHAVEENNEALQGEGESFVNLGDLANSLADKLGVKLPEGATNALNGIKGFSAGTAAAMAAAAASVAAVVEGVKKLHETTLEAAADVDNIITESMKTGLSTETIQQFQYAENLIDVSYQTISGSLTKLTRAMENAKDGNADAIASFQELGVSIYDLSTGELRSAEEVFYDVVDALGEIENSTDRDATAMELLGKSAQDLNPLIIQGTDTLRDLASEATKVGYVLDESQIKKLGEVDDAYQRMTLSIEATKKQIAAEFAPAAKAGMELFADVVSEAGKALIDSGLIQNTASILESIIDTTRNVGDLAKAIPGLDMALGALKVTLGAIAQFFALIADSSNVLVGLLTLNFDKVSTGLGWGYSSGNASHWQKTYMMQTGTYEEYSGYGKNTYLPEIYRDDYYSDQFASRNASGNDNFRGGWTHYGENGRELAYLPSGTRILSAQETREQTSGNNIFYVTIDAKNVEDFNRIVRMAESARRTSRMEGVPDE